ncbi:MAG: hypothetical protein LBR85_01175 [Oscillospiraceae bacterium]|nr:hypothetical protein [Oscillospiraceae bacterium]
MRRIVLLFRGISGLYKTEPLVAWLAVLSFTASSFAMFFLYGFSENMAAFTIEDFKAAQRRYGISFAVPLSHNKVEEFLLKLLPETTNIIYTTPFDVYELCSTDNFNTLTEGAPSLSWTETYEGGIIKNAPRSGEIFVSYHQLDYHENVSYLGLPFQIGGLDFTISAVVRNYPIYNDIYLSLKDYRTLTGVTKKLGIVFASPLTHSEREALDVLVSEYGALYSFVPPPTNEKARDITASYFVQFAVMVSLSIMCVCAVYYYLLCRNMLVRLVYYCTGQSRLAVFGYLLAETIVVGVACMFFGLLISILSFRLFTDYALTLSNMTVSGILYLGVLFLCAVVFGQKTVTGMRITGLREELR